MYFWLIGGKMIQGRTGYIQIDELFFSKK